MTQYFIEIFSNQSDKARLATTLIAAFMAVAVVLLNQWFNSRRARKDKIIEKIEETFNSLITIQESMTNLHSEIVTNYHKYPSEKTYVRRMRPIIYGDEYDEAHPIHLEIIKEGERLLMLSQLYFRELKESIVKINKYHQEIYNNFTSSKQLSGYLSEYKDLKNKCETEFKIISESLTLIMSKHMH